MVVSPVKLCLINSHLPQHGSVQEAQGQQDSNSTSSQAHGFGKAESSSPRAKPCLVLKDRAAPAPGSMSGLISLALVYQSQARDLGFVTVDTKFPLHTAPVPAPGCPAPLPSPIPLLATAATPPQPSKPRAPQPRPHAARSNRNPEHLASITRISPPSRGAACESCGRHRAAPGWAGLAAGCPAGTARGPGQDGPVAAARSQTRADPGGLHGTARLGRARPRCGTAPHTLR